MNRTEESSLTKLGLLGLLRKPGVSLSYSKGLWILHVGEINRVIPRKIISGLEMDGLVGIRKRADRVLAVFLKQ